MIRPPGWNGVVFTEAEDGDQRLDPEARERVAEALGIGSAWASLRQVHGDSVIEATIPGEQGEADALWTRSRGLPLAIFTADCHGVVLIAPTAVGVAHAGWRGALANVVTALRSAMADAGHPPQRAALGPGIGPCCFEVGAELADRFPEQATSTTWGTTSVDLRSSIRAEIEDLDVWESGACTHHGEGWYSHRRDATPSRLATLGWLS